MKTLSIKAKRMAEFMVTGETAVKAYALAGYTGIPEDNAHKIPENPRFQDYLAELKQESRTEAVISRSRALELLSEIAQDKVNVTPSERIRAIAELSKMEGWNAPDRIEATVVTLSDLVDLPATHGLPKR